MTKSWFLARWISTDVFFLWGSFISAIQKHPYSRQMLWRPFDHLLSPRIYDWIRNCPLTSRLYPQPLLFPFFLLFWWDLSLSLSFFNYCLLSTSSVGKPRRYILLRTSVPYWDHPLLAWVGDERNRRRQKWKKTRIWDWEALMVARRPCWADT